MKEHSTADILKLIKKNKITFFLTTLIFLILGFYFNNSTDKSYTASASVIQNPDSSIAINSMNQSQGIERLLNINSGSDQTDVFIEIMHSQKFLEYYFNKNNIAPFLLAGKVDSNSSKVIIDPAFYNEISKQWVSKRNIHNSRLPNINEAIRHWKKNVFNIEIANNSILKLKIRYFDASLAKEWLDFFIIDFNRYIAQQTIDNSMSTSDYLLKTLAVTQSESTREALNFILIEQQRKLALASSIPDFALKTVNPAVEPDIPSNISGAIVLILSFMFGVIASFTLILFKSSIEN
jgi:hypothetical protein